MEKLKIGILGSGVVAQSLANGFLKYGHEVTLGTRNSEKLSDWKKTATGNPVIASFKDAVKNSDIIVLAVKGNAAENALELSGIENLTGKTVIDATNPLTDSPPEKGVLKLFTSQEESFMERLQKKIPNAHFVKAFNSVGSALMVNPDFNGIKPSMFICGNNEQSKKQVKLILDQFGWETEDMGDVEAARAIEPLCILWCIRGFKENKWSHAFKLLKN